MLPSAEPQKHNGTRKRIPLCFIVGLLGVEPRLDVPGSSSMLLLSSAKSGRRELNPGYMTPSHA